jgi:acetyl esterase/lipase
MRRTRIGLAALCAGMLALTTVAAPGAVARQELRGELVSTTLISELSRAEAADYVATYGFDPARAKHGVRLYLVEYRTVDVDGAPTTASALAVLPTGRAKYLRPVAWLHGTRANRADTGSRSENLDRGAAVLFATAGYATAAPDYLGLGTGPGTHPYVMAEPTVTASVDSLRATRELAGRSGTRLDRDVLVTGFSQGGQAAMFVGEALQEHADRHFRLGAIAPISGPHDISGAELPAALDGRLDGQSAAFYLSYAIVAWQREYHLYDDPAEAFRAPYDTTIPALFDGEHSEPEIFAALPPSPAELFTDEFLARLAAPSGELARAIEENDGGCADWRPRVPVRLYTSTGDRDVVIDNSRNCQDSLADSGAKAELVDLGDLDHFTAGATAVPLVLDWFS